jgi:hypothetical protein
MKKSRLLGVVCAIFIVFASFNSSAAIIVADWQTVGDGLITQDTDSGMEWLDLTATIARSYNDISSKLGAGQEFEGWEYATADQISTFFGAVAAPGTFVEGESASNNVFAPELISLWGSTNIGTNFVRSIYITVEVPSVV